MMRRRSQASSAEESKKNNNKKILLLVFCMIMLKIIDLIFFTYNFKYPFCLRTQILKLLQDCTKNVAVNC